MPLRPSASARGVMLLTLLALAGGSLAATSRGVTSRLAAETAGFAYVEMSDGVRLAVAVGLPRNYEEGERYPALVTMTGYPGGVTAGSVQDYVLVAVMQRGTGCSGGEFELFTERVAQDGYELIEDWIVHQPWSNGRTGVTGHSFPGLNGFLIAGTSPPHLDAVAVSGVIEDFYRGISYPGGIANAGFPVLWTALRSQPDDEQASLEARGLDELAAGDPTCAANIASRPPNAPFAVDAAANPFDGAYWQERSLAEAARNITAPIHLVHSWQDNSTGPSGASLWRHIPETTPKRLAAGNGAHGTFRAYKDDRDAWLDCWILRAGEDCDEGVTARGERVRLHFETTGSNQDAVTNPPLTGPEFPLPATNWTRYFLAPDGALATTPPAEGAGGDTYLTAPLDLAGEQGLAGRTGSTDGLVYDHAFPAPTTIAGPIAASLWITTEQPDADLFVSVADVDPDGRVQYLQRGMLRATHRALDEDGSVRVDRGPHAGELIQPRHPHTVESLEPVTPGEAVRLDVEIFPVAHHFRAGHTLRVEIGTPPQRDPVGRSYVYAATSPPGSVTLLRDAAHPSSLLLPVLPVTPPLAPAPVPCGDQIGIRCG